MISLLVQTVSLRHLSKSIQNQVLSAIHMLEKLMQKKRKGI